MSQDFAKASQLGLWSGPSGGKASQLWGAAGLRPYSVFNNESSESLNSSTARFRSSSPTHFLMLLSHFLSEAENLSSS